MEGTFGSIRRFFTDRIFGNVIRFLFDRFFGSIFTTNINLSNIVDLKNCHLKDLTIDADKINKKAFKNGPLKLFSGKVGSISIKFPPSINALLTESVEVRLDRLDILLVMNDVDFSKAKQEAEAQLAKIFNPENLQNIFEEKSSGQKPTEELDIYKKIIHRILFNIKLKVENVCLRIVSEKPYKDVRLPIAPCFMLKVSKIEIKKNFDQKNNLDNKDSSSNLNFVKNQNYDIDIYGITMHVMSNYELKPDEYIGKVVDPKAEFPFTYPNESHPSTIFVCACQKLGKSKFDEGNSESLADDLEPISIHVNLSNDKSKSIDINIPNIEVMLDFLKIKFLSKYIDKFMEWKKYLDYKKALLEQLGSQKKSPKAAPPETPFHLRKGSFGFDFEPTALQKNKHSDYQHVATFGNSNNPNQNPQASELEKDSKIRIAGYDIDVNYFQKEEESENSTNEDSQAQPKKEFKIDLQGIDEIISEPFELTAENILDTSNVHINLNIKSVYIYFLKSCTAFLETEFKRWWLFGSEPQTDLQKSFNKKIPINYFQLKLTKLNLSVHTKESQIALVFSSLQVLDVNRVDSPLNIKTSASNSAQFNPGSGMNKSQAPWNKSELFYSFKFDKSMMGSGLRPPELKRNTTNDLNETSMLFQSAVSDITKDFLTMREIRKQIIDWEIDPKREHFCVNVVFRFNKTGQNYSFKDKKTSDKYKTVKYLEDSVIHSPLNTESLTEDLPGVQIKPTLRLSTKGGKILASLDLPPVYINFYMSLIHDINFLLHNASDSYKICENWYFEQNQNLLRKWEQELREASQDTQPKEDLFKKREKEKYLKEEVDNMVEAYFRRQNLMLSLEVVLGAPLIKVVFNLESPKKDPSHCFCGFSSHYFGESLTHNTIFKKEFVVLELCQLAVKILKIPPSDFSYPQDIPSKKVLGFYIHTLFQSLDIYIPSKMTDENKVLMIKLLSLHAVQDEGKMIIPSILLKLFDDNLVSPFTKQSSEMYSKNLLAPFIEEDKKEDQRKQNDILHIEQMPVEFINSKPYNTQFQKHMNKNIASDLNYLKMLEEDSSMSLTVTFPKFEIFISKQSLEFLQSFSSDWITLIEDVNEKLSHLLEQEKRIFHSILEIHSQPSKTPQISNFSVYIEEISVQVFQDEKINQNFQQIIDAKKNKVKISTLGSSISLDNSFSGPVFEKNYSYSHQVSEIRCCFLKKEFERSLASSFKFIIRQNELTIYKNPKEIIDIIHLEIQDLLIVDRNQEKPNFGSFLDASEGDKGKEYYDYALEYEAQDCIVYKQTALNTWSRPLRLQRASKEPDAFKEWKSKGILILENNHQSFLNKNKNIFCVGILKSLREGRMTTDIDVHIGFLVLRSDFKFGFIDMFKDLLSGLKKETKEENPIDSVYGLDKKENNEETRMMIQFSLDQILIDFNPYLYYDYCKTFGKINYNLDPESLNPEHRSMLFYSETRSLIAIESLGLRLRKRGNKVQFDEFSLSSLDLFMRFQKGDSAFKENRVILQSKENSFFEREFEELKNYHAFKSHPFYLSGLSVNSIGTDLQNVDIKLEKIELKVYADTIPVLEKHCHLILCLIEKQKQKNEDSFNGILEEEKVESEANPIPSRTEIQTNKPKDQVTIEDEIEIDKEYFAPVEVNHVQSRALDNEGNENGFDVIEEINDEDLSNLKEIEAHSMSYESVGSMPSISTSFVSSSTVFYFDEENLHEFSLDHQEVVNKISFKLGEISLRIFDSYELDTNPQILEVNFDQFSDNLSEPQHIIVNKENNKIERLPKCVNEKEKSECIMVVVESLKLGFTHFKKNENQRTNMAWRSSISLQNFEVLDCFKNSKKNEATMKLVSKHNQKSPEALKYNLLQSVKKGNEFIMQNTFDAIFECFENYNCKQKDIRAFIAFHPLEIHIGVPHFNFGKLFSAKMKLKYPTNQIKIENLGEDLIQNRNEISSHPDLHVPKKPSEVFFTFFHVAPFEVKMNINLDISVVNLDLFKNLKLSFPTNTIRGAENLDELKKELVDFYLTKIKMQIGSFVKDLPLLRNIKNLTNATLNLFYSPYMNYRESGNVLTGLKDGVVGFAGSVSNESVNLFTFVTTMLDNVTNLTGIKEKLNKNQDSNKN